MPQPLSSAFCARGLVVGLALLLQACAHQSFPAYETTGEYAACRPVNWMAERCLPDDVTMADLAAFLDGRPEALKPFYARAFIAGERNAVLNWSRLGLAAMEAGLLSDAAHAFDEALLRIESIRADDVKAAKAKSKFAPEAVKDFKGEPYERAMAYYYRGLLYFADGDYENARAAFKQAEFQDTISEDDETYNADFALMNYLVGWSAWCQGRPGLAAGDFEAATRFRPDLPLPRPADNHLLIAERGSGPRKVGAGQYGEVLQFVRLSPTASAVRLGPRGSRLVEAGDLYYQATTRDGRAIDGILAGKARFKDATATAATAAIHTGVRTAQVGAVSRSDEAVYAGLALALVGLVLAGTSQAATPEADIRYWDTLPAYVDVAALADTGGVRPVEFLGPRNRVLGNAVAMIDQRAGTCRLTWTRELSALKAPPVAPGAGLSSAALDAEDAGIRAGNRQYRRYLLNNR